MDSAPPEDLLPAPETPGEDWRRQLESLLSERPLEADARAHDCLAGLAGDTSRPWILHGAGNLGRKVLDQMAREGFRVVAVTDGMPSRHGTRFGDHEVQAPEAALARWGHEAAVLVSIFNAGHSFAATRRTLARFSAAPVVPVQVV